ncbi:MAG: diacylglycerol kinase [Gammaproteobacteria bacterium]|nr:diacylglycerol kinase [Gammaproteobacteria bacterium]
MANNKNKGLTRIVNAFGYSMQGFSAAYKHEEAFRQEILLAVVLIPLAFYLDVSTIERLLMVLSVLFVLVVEIINSAIEAVVDRFGGEHHELSGRAKDMGSAAVWLALAMLSFTWVMILL